MESNKLIAEFMGHKLGLDGDGMGEPQCRIFENGLGTKRIEDTYNKSWDWLMPVISKITKDERYIENEYRESIMDVVPYGNIEDTIKTIVEFIKNQND